MLVTLAGLPGFTLGVYFPEQPDSGVPGVAPVFPGGRVKQVEPRISIVTLGVSDLAKSVAFYRDGLGLPQRQDGADSEEIAFFETRGTWLALYPRAALAEEVQAPALSQGAPSFTLAHNVRTREEVDARLTEAVAAGARLVKPAQDTFWGGYSGYFADPDGYFWEVCWNPFFWIE